MAEVIIGACIFAAGNLFGYALAVAGIKSAGEKGANN